MRDTKASWQKILAQGFSSARELLAFLELPESLASQNAEKQFQTRVPRGFANLMQRENPNDPLLRQVLALHDEGQVTEGYTEDPLLEKAFNTQAGLIHKYHGRVLLTLVGACAINCRYCFRRHFPYEENNPGREGWNDVFSYIAADKSLSEVILSGGDPLLANDTVLSYILSGLEAIPHVRTVRIHTRIPVVLPERIDSNLIELLKRSSLTKVIVLHSNHPNELDDRVAFVCQDLRAISCHLLNQSVLLAGVNDDEITLAALSRRLFECGVMPYYLHLLDKVKGAAHFEVTLTTAQKLYKALQALLPGYLVPRLACEIPAEKHKTLVGF
ncbi:EF-P beta-lysylation protein EpmB [Legionella impletisoli]|uniref:L-lysine 2,3-aminomutase n=1 Tax=Legionella impletisoli TaxID=343510 RepID=A0A917K0N2_9GAMM|nr:EF-P beta-lysylation protein EpmB [Legionella impletisoli]GGI93444.1 EF-P beta-lysylation protein EpmB [Legionella impletisoli]